MLNIENCTTIQLNYKLLEKIADELTRKDIDLNICYNPTIQEYNSLYRGKNTPTDVLSFPLDSDAIGSDFLPLGSIMISVDYIITVSNRLGHSYDDELSLLFIHGLLHLLGYDHEKDKGEMREQEEALIQKFSLPKSLIVRTEKE